MALRIARKVAQLSGLTVIGREAGVGWFSVAGALDGYPLAIIWATEPLKNQMMPYRHVIQFIIRFQELAVDGQLQLRRKILNSPEIGEALNQPDFFKKKSQDLGIGAFGVDFLWGHFFPRPSEERVVKLLQGILAAVREVAEPVRSGCQSCGTKEGGELYYVDKIPNSICASCRERLAMEDRKKEQAETRRSPNWVMGLLAGALVAFILGIGWGRLLFATGEVVSTLAMLIGACIGWTVHKAMGKVTVGGQALAIGLTGASSTLGYTLFVALSVMSNAHSTLTAKVFLSNFPTFFRLMLVQPYGYVSIFFALFTAFAMAWFYRKPKIVRLLVPIASPVAVSR